MQLGIVGLGRMGANMALRLMKSGHEVYVNDTQDAAVRELTKKGAKGSTKIEEFVRGMSAPRTIWLMVPAGAVDAVLESFVPLLAPNDVVVDGGNSHYQQDLRRAESMRAKGLHHVDVGVSGGVWGLDNGYCLMIGGEKDVVDRLDPIFRDLAPGVDAAPRTASGEPSQAEHGYLYCGPHGAGHFVKMVHNGIEYGLMAAYAEGLAILNKANVGKSQQSTSAEISPLADPELYQYDFDLAAISEVWRRGSVVRSWLLDLAASAFKKDPTLEKFSGHVADSGEGRWTLQAAIDEGVPAPVIANALFARFASRGEGEIENKFLSALRLEFGGHVEKSG